MTTLTAAELRTALDAEGRARWHADEARILADEQRQLWVEAAHRIAEILTAVSPDHADLAREQIDRASRACRSAERRHRKRTTTERSI